MSGGFENVPKRVLSNCVLQTLILIFGIVITTSMVKVGKVSDQNTSTVSAVIDDWSTYPFVSITVTDNKCPAGTESLFVREWRGTEPGCLVN